MEIIYRAWHKEWSEMIYSTTGHNWFGKREFCPIQFDVGFSHYPQDENWVIMPGIEINNKKYFVGDILEIKNLPCQLQKAILYGIVIFENGSFGVEIKKVIQWDNYSKPIELPHKILIANLLNNRKIKTIGNVYENSELIGE